MGEALHFPSGKHQGMRSEAVDPAEVVPRSRESERGPLDVTASTKCETIYSGGDDSRLGGEVVAGAAVERWGLASSVPERRAGSPEVPTPLGRSRHGLAFPSE